MKIVIALSALTLACSANAANITDVPALPSADRLQINGLEQGFFDFYEAQGLQPAIQREYKAISQPEVVTAELRAKLADLDKNCGKLTSIQRAKSESSGSRVVRDSFVIVQGECLLQLDLTYVRFDGGWRFNQFNVTTYNGNDWKF